MHPHDDRIKEIIDLLNDEDYRGLRKKLDTLKGSYAGFFLLKAMEDDRCDCPDNHVEVIEKLDALLVDRRPRVY